MGLPQHRRAQQQWCQPRVSPGLGRHGEGRVEPIHAVVLPRGKSLDQCMETLQKGAKGSKAGPNRPPKCRGRGGRPGGRPPPRGVFDFLNEKLRGQAPGALEAGSALPGRGSGKEMYHASKNAKRALSLRLFQTEEKIEQAQRDIRSIQEALARNTGRYWGGTVQRAGRRVTMPPALLWVPSPQFTCKSSPQPRRVGCL